MGGTDDPHRAAVARSLADLCDQPASELMANFAVVHSIPSPYRMHLFRVLARELERLGIQFHVHFMAAGDSSRDYWQSSVADAGFAHKVWTDVGPMVRGKRWHLNPGLLRELRSDPPSYLLVGGPWDSLTGIAASVIGLPSRKIGWLEGSPNNLGRAGVAGRMKKYVLRHYDFLAVPGSEGCRYVDHFLAGNPRPPRVLLPNLVDESLFTPVGSASSDRVRHRLGIREHERLAICPARLIPEKGISEFLNQLSSELLSGWRLVVFGDGPLRSEVDAAIRASGLESHVSIHPSMEYRGMPEVYAAADLFVLPSLRDRNPLSVVEALHSGLPVVISDRVGNLPEALSPGVNGWTFDPMSRESVRTTMSAALRTPKATLRVMGDASTERAQRHWSSSVAVRQFLADILTSSSLLAPNPSRSG